MTKDYILVAEDDADDRYLLQTAFAEKGGDEKIQFVEDGVELLEHLQLLEKNAGKKVYPSFILLDLNMPKKDGREVLQELKSHPIFKKIPVIVFTTTKSDKEVNRCYETGANMYVVKPGNFTSLLKVIGDLRNLWLNVASVPA